MIAKLYAESARQTKDHRLEEGAGAGKGGAGDVGRIGQVLHIEAQVDRLAGDVVPIQAKVDQAISWGVKTAEVDLVRPIVVGIEHQRPSFAERPLVAHIAVEGR